MSVTGDQISAALEATLVGGLVSFILYGCSTVQALVYFRVTDRQFALKISILLLWLCDTLHTYFTGFVLLAVYTPIFWMNSKEAFETGSEFSIVAFYFSDALLELFARLIYVYRIWMLSGRSLLVSAVPCVLSIGTFACGLVFTFKHTSANLIERWVHDSSLIAVIFSLRLLSDIAITGFVCVILLRKRQEAFMGNKSLVRSLLKYSFSTGAVTAALTLACLIAFLTLYDFVFLGLFFVLSKSYSVALLASVNSKFILFDATGRQDDLYSDAKPYPRKQLQVQVETAMFSDVSSVAPITPMQPEDINFYPIRQSSRYTQLARPPGAVINAPPPISGAKAGYPRTESWHDWLVKEPNMHATIQSNGDILARRSLQV